MLQTGIFLEELPLKPELGDFISTKCSAADLFDRRVSFEKEAESSYARNTGNGKCVLCAKEMEIEAKLLYLFSNGINAPEFGIQSFGTSSNMFPSEEHGLIGNTHDLANISSLWNERIAGVRNIKISLLGDSTAFRTTNGK